MPDIQTLRWIPGAIPQLELIDQRILPRRIEWRSYGPRTGAAGVARAIRSMVVRGAPASGVAAAYGMAFQVVRLRSRPVTAARIALASSASVLAASRPTAVNLFWALDRMRAAMDAHRGDSERLFAALERLARRMHADDIAINRALGRHAAALLHLGARVLTHCNAGALATAGYGTALGVMPAARAKITHVWVDETRPFLQGARLTAWDLMRESIPCRLITESMAAHFMQAGQVDAIIVGTDRVAANGDVANKIGTHGLAALARHHRIPFYVACPLACIDMATPDGAGIPIEERAATEVTGYASVHWAPVGVAVANPAFDVTPRPPGHCAHHRMRGDRQAESRSAARFSRNMIGTRALAACVWACVAWLTMAHAMAASFDCNRARSKLNRVICSDAALSRLDETVWNTYGERIRGLTSLQYAHVRERHLLWRRSRGLYETTVEALTHEYTSHLAWLTHPLLGLEGRYERGSHGSSAASIEIEVDARAPGALDARGLATTPLAVAWRAQAQHHPHADSSSAPAARDQGIRLRMRPRLLGHLPPVTDSCEFDIVFSADEATLTSSGECGAHFGGSYARTLRD